MISWHASGRDESQLSECPVLVSHCCLKFKLVALVLGIGCAVFRSCLKQPYTPDS